MLKLQNELAELMDPATRGDVAIGVRDAKTVGDTEIRIRGEAEKLGSLAPRGFLGVLEVPDAPEVNRKTSGRLELALWLTSDKNPLTPRVIVNRVWSHLFGDGLVRSVDNFGSTGDVPSHPELLDFLASHFVEDGWSVKRLVRSIVLSRAYRLSSEKNAANFAFDPANRLLWRHRPRRLDAEELRDATLAAVGNLDTERPQASPVKEFKVIEFANNGAQAKRILEFASVSRHRSVYLPLLRGVTPTNLAVFDFAEQGMVTGKRDSTTVAVQALYLLNNPFIRRQALTLAERLVDRSEIGDEERVNWAYRLTLGRPARAEEVNRAKAFLASYSSSLLAPPLSVAENVNAATASTSKPKELKAPTAAAQKVAEPPVNPDEIIQVEAPAVLEEILPRDEQTGAWAALCQALFASAEFRYVK